MKLTRSCLAEAGTSIRNLPFRSVLTPSVVPSTTTDAASTGPMESLTVPVTVRLWAEALPAAKETNAKTSAKRSAAVLVKE